MKPKEEEANLAYMTREVGETGDDKQASCQSAPLLVCAVCSGDFDAKNLLTCVCCGGTQHTYCKGSAEKKLTFIQECAYCGEPHHAQCWCPRVVREAPPPLFVNGKVVEMPEAIPELTFTDTESAGEAETHLAQEHALVCVEETWVVDSGASSHYTNVREGLSNYQSKTCRVMTAGGELSALGVGDYGILEGVKYIPNIVAKLISVPRLCVSGFLVTMDARKCVIKSTSTGQEWYAALSGGLYRMALPRENRAQLLLASHQPKNKAVLWHSRLMHINLTKVCELKLPGVAANMLRDARVQMCSTCARAHAEKLPLSGNIPEQSNVLGGRIHVDWCGPIKPTSYSGKKHFQVLVEDKSGEIHVHFAASQTGEESVAGIRQYVSRRLTANDLKLQAMRTDPARCYTHGPVHGYVQSMGVSHEVGAAEQHSHNPKAERAIGVLQRMARAAMIHTSVPAGLWPEALAQACYVHARIPHSSTPGRAPPLQVSLAKVDPPSLAYVRVFGCYAVFTRLDQELPRGAKFEARGIEGAYLGNEQNRVGYRVWDPVGKVVRFRKNVYFDESRQGVFEVGEQSQLVMVEWCLEEDGPVEIQDTEESKHGERGSVEIQNTEESKHGERGSVEIQNTEEPERTVNGIDIQRKHDEKQPIAERMNELRRKMHAGKLVSGVDVGDGSDAGVLAGALAPVSGSRPVPGKDAGGGAGVKSSQAGGALRRSSRQQAPRDFLAPMQAHVVMARDIVEPTTYYEAVNGPHADLFAPALAKEYAVANQRNVWEKAYLPEGRKAIDYKLVFKAKSNPDGTLDKVRARLSLKGFQQKPGVDYHETFSPVVKHATVRTQWTVAARKRQDLRHGDVTHAFFYSNLDEVIFSKIPPGLVLPGQGDCLKLNKAVPGLHYWPRSLRCP